MKYSGLITCLGNPGKQYEGTRHNCGFIFADALLKKAAHSGEVEELSGKKFLSLLWRIRLPELEGIWLLCKPQTFMNESGRAIKPLISWYDIETERLLVVQDELDLPVGSLRFKTGGGLAGHNGLKSIAQALGTHDFCRLRIGIGKPVHKEEVIDWVLNRPSREESSKISNIMPYALETLFIFSKEGAAAAMQYAHSISTIGSKQ